MYCNKCGKEVDDLAKYCPFCGAQVNKKENSIEKTISKTLKDDEKALETKVNNNENDEYMFFENFNFNKRKIILNIVKVCSVLLSCLVFIGTIMFIKSEMDAAENFKFVVYVLKYIYAFRGIYLLQVLTDTLKFFLKIKKSEIDLKFNKNIIFVAELSYAALYVIAIVSLNALNTGDSLLLLYAISENSYWDLFSVFKVTIITIVIATILKYFIETKMVKKTSDKNE